MIAPLRDSQRAHKHSIVRQACLLTLGWGVNHVVLTEKLCGAVEALTSPTTCQDVFHALGGLMMTHPSVAIKSTPVVQNVPVDQNVVARPHGYYEEDLSILCLGPFGH